MRKEFSSLIEIVFSSKNEEYLKGLSTDLNQEYSLFKTFGSTVIESEITNDMGSISDSIPIWHKTYFLNIVIELQSKSLDNLNHMISIYFHWASILSAECKVLNIKQAENNLS